MRSVLIKSYTLHYIILHHILHYIINKSNSPHHQRPKLPWHPYILASPLDDNDYTPLFLCLNLGGGLSNVELAYGGLDSRFLVL